MLKRLSLIFCILLTGCSLSFNNIATEGHSSDVVDEQQEASPTVSPNLVIPASAL